LTCRKFLQPFPLQLELSQPLIDYLERLTATQELITNELIINQPPQDDDMHSIILGIFSEASLETTKSTSCFTLVSGVQSTYNQFTITPLLKLGVPTHKVHQLVTNCTNKKLEQDYKNKTP
jgi:hypothetical protein